jgi:thymidylate synthase (FAD)
MIIIEPYFVIESEIDGDKILQQIEKAGRTAYKSESKITNDSAETFVANIVKRGHLSVIEHVSVTVRIICDRGVSHEIVRHRIASYTQESTRYCNYSNGETGDSVTFIAPFFWKTNYPEYLIWQNTMSSCNEAYKALIKMGATPQEARSVLPNSLKTEIVVTMNLREWRHFFELRTAQSAHPQMQQISIPLLKEFQKKIPIIFNDIDY